MTATVKTLDALKSATLRLERLEVYCRQPFSAQHSIEVDWPGPNGMYEAHTDVKKALAKLLMPQIPALVSDVLEAARRDVADLTTQLRLEIDAPMAT